MENKKTNKKKLIKKIVAGILVIGIVIVLFFLGLFTTNIVMKLVVDHGKEVRVPQLIGLTYSRATDICKDNKLYIQDVRREYSSTYPDGYIIEQNPKDSSLVKRFRTIDVVISKGAKLIKVPLLVGTDLELVKEQLNTLGLKVGKISKYYNQEIDKDIVISSVPAAGGDVEIGGTIDLDVSLGSMRSNNSGSSSAPSEDKIDYEDLFE